MNDRPLPHDFGGKQMCPCTLMQMARQGKCTAHHDRGAEKVITRGAGLQCFLVDVDFTSNYYVYVCVNVYAGSPFFHIEEIL